MSKIPSVLKAKHGEIIAAGHAKFAPVAFRKPYKDDDEGEGGTGLQLEEHPWLSELPIGAASDLTAIANQNSEALDEAMDNVNDCSYELRMANRKTFEQAMGKEFNPTPSPGI